MGLEKQSFDIIAVFFGLLTIAFGLVSFGYDFTYWLVPVTLIFAGVILVFEVQLKTFLPIHKITKLSTMQYITLIIAGLSIILGFVLMPPFELYTKNLQLVGSVLLIFQGIFIILEWFTHKK